MTKTQIAEQKAFEKGADYATGYLIEVINNLAKGVEDYDSGAASLLQYIASMASTYNCGDYPGADE